FNVNRDLGGYLPGDRVGSFGIEHAMESVLRGLRGRAILHRDTGQEDRIEPRPGRDVQLSIDIQLQARIQAILQPEWGLTTVQEWHGNPDVPLGTPLYGAAVVLDVDSGQVLAMVSTPTYPEEDQIDAAVRDINHPLINRPVAAVYAPGSTLKPIIYCLAARERAIEVGQIFTCNGAFDPRHPHQWRCWGYRPEQGLYHTHGSIGPAQAIATSCNIYFYNCGQRLGAQRLIRGLLDWGFGKPTGVELPEEISGLLPSLDGPNPPGYELTDSNAVNMGIGQGPIAVPPIQVAAAHAALARGGYWVSPTLLSSPMPTQSRHNLHLPPAAVEQALQGIYESANNPVYGTAHHLGGREPIMNAPGVVVRAKTGTAQAPVQFQDLNDNGRLDAEEPILRQGSHSWYVAHVAPTGHDRAQYIICVLVEYGGSGGRVSGPIANQIIHALKAEGYL
ncbi:MAG TPA: penicillin-binding transpeptidase domain-containing protein, partial [Phycisphaeraceae bacterium]